MLSLRTGALLWFASRALSLLKANKHHDEICGGDILPWLTSVCESDSTNKPDLILLIEIHHVISEGNQDSLLALYK